MKAAISLVIAWAILVCSGVGPIVRRAFDQAKTLPAIRTPNGPPETAQITKNSIAHAIVLRDNENVRKAAANRQEKKDDLHRRPDPRIHREP